MSDADRVIETARAAGYDVKHFAADDVERIYYRPENIFAPMRLVGLVIIREGRIVYAEMLGRLFPWWGPGEDAAEITTDELIHWIEVNPA